MVAVEDIYKSDNRPNWVNHANKFDCCLQLMWCGVIKHGSGLNERGEIGMQWSDENRCI